MKTWRLIIHNQPFSGARNMAIDEFLFLSLPEKNATTLRFYSWEKPTASLGQGQLVERVLDLDACRRLGVDVVRRPTGGKLVLHHQEITYALCSTDTELFTDSLASSYRLISMGLMEGLRLLGLHPELSGPADTSYSRGNLPCFALPAQDEVVIAGRKIIGSAQRRLGSRFLQHGSLPLRPQEDWLRQISRLEDTAKPLRMISLEEALGRPVSFEEIVPFLARGLADFFQVQLERSELTSAEMKEVAFIEKARYANDAWTFRRQGGK